MPPPPTEAVEFVEMSGHIVDSLLLPKVLDAILSRGGRYHIDRLDLGQRQDDPSFVRIEVRADSPEALEAILREVHPHGAVPAQQADCRTAPADIDGAFPDGFYCSTNFRTQVRLGGEWVDVEDQEMDCGIVVDPEGAAARCVPMISVRKGDKVVVGRAGTRVFPPEAEIRRHDLFEFMASPVSSERPKAVSVREVAQAMRRTRKAGEKILAVLGPAVVHTGGGELVAKMIRAGYLNVLFAGNALATHDIEAALLGTSLGVKLATGVPMATGHNHHLRAINAIRAAGGIRAAVEQGVLTSGVMHACVTHGVDFVLAGSIRDDGPLPDVITNVVTAQDEMRSRIPGIGLAIMVATTLHSVATGNLLPATVRIICVDNNTDTITKLMDRGTRQAFGLVTDCQFFLKELAGRLEGRRAE
jgi:lysine-ketoglutarate reductase/saccharopine dehydrogenase-like protein (TIGR00300 family)